MKKLFLALATIGFLFIGCNRDDNDNGYENGETRKLPSKMTATWLNEFGDPNHWFQTFEYDAQNRLIKVISWNELGDWADTLQFLYETGNTPTKMLARGRDGEYMGQRENTFEYVDNLVIIIREGVGWISRDTVELNASNQMVRWIIDGEGGEGIEYNSNGNISRLVRNEHSIVEISYSNKKSIFRYANIPSWLMFWIFHVEFPVQGYMPSEFRINGEVTTTFTYTLNGDWVKTRTRIGDADADEVMTIEYINAR